MCSKLISSQGHEYVVQMTKMNETLSVRFTKSDEDEDMFITYEPASGLLYKRKTDFDNLLEKVKENSQPCFGMMDDEFNRCFADRISKDVAKGKKNNSRLKTYRDLMATRLRNYTCYDDSLNTSLALRSTVFNVDNASYNSDILYEMSQAKIWTVQNFITEEECNILMEYGRPRLLTATVAGEDGLPSVSVSRRAQQAAYLMNSPDDPLVALKRRVLEMTNLMTGYNLDLPGQEDLTIIQYNEDDLYAPHCDGACDGSKHIPGGRVASAIMYCQVAERGGGTTFTKADVFVKPTKGLAAFFSYKGSDGMMEPGYTEHSGCPVLEGEKWLATFWMREGVTMERSWVNFDPFGVPTDYYATATV